jgi:hypothetical protein
MPKKFEDCADAWKFSLTLIEIGYDATMLVQGSNKALYTIVSRWANLTSCV